MTKSPKTRLPLNFEEIKEKHLKAGVVYALRTYSFYDTQKSERKILKTDASGRKLETMLKDGNRNHVTKAVTQLKKDNVLVDMGKFYVIKDIPKEVSSLELPTEFVKELLRTRNSEYIMIYLWLYRRYNMRKSQGQLPLFTVGDILSKVFFIKGRNKSTYKRINQTLADLVADGLVDFRVVRIGRTYLKEILGVSEQFMTRKIVEKAIEQQQVNKEDDYIDTDTLDYDNLQIEEAGPVITSPAKVLFCLKGSNKKYTYEEIKDELFMQSREWVEENFYALPENRELIYSSGLDEEFPQYFGF